MASNGKWDWFAFYPKDFLTDEKVIVMSAMECGAYVRLLCVAWNSHPIGTLIASDEALYRYATLSAEEWADHKDRIMAPFVLKGDRWHQKRMVEEGRAAEEKHLKFVAAGRVGGNKKWGHSQANGQAIATLKPGSTKYSTVTSTREEEEKRAAEREAIDLSDGFDELQKLYPRLNVPKEWSDAKAKLGKEPPRGYFEKWLKNEQSKLVPGKPPEDKPKQNKRYPSDDWHDLVAEAKAAAAQGKKTNE